MALPSPMLDRAAWASGRAIEVPAPENVWNRREIASEGTNAAVPKMENGVRDGTPFLILGG
jgi:hypothetical protein